MTDAASDESWFDADIAAMSLGYGEKAGLQIYRNYTTAFEAHARKLFVESLDREVLDTAQYERLATIIVEEEPRFLPVIVCSFADELLKATYKTVIPTGIPGGKAALFEGYGPLSSLSQRVKLAFAFDVLSADLMVELDRLRTTRNKISHSWDIVPIDHALSGGRLAEMINVAELLAEREELAKEFAVQFSPVARFRMTLVWLVGRLIYEAATYGRCKAAKLDPHSTLYGNNRPKWLGDISKVALSASRKIASSDATSSR